jgi:hypothetical protein
MVSTTISPAVYAPEMLCEIPNAYIPNATAIPPLETSMFIPLDSQQTMLKIMSQFQTLPREGDLPLHHHQPMVAYTSAVLHLVA